MKKLFGLTTSEAAVFAENVPTKRKYPVRQLEGEVLTGQTGSG